MHTFKTPSDLLDYIPNCLVCGKTMNIVIDGMLAPVLPSKPRWGGGKENIHLRMILKDGVLRSKHKNHSVSIDASTGLIIDGQDIINRLTTNWTYVHKMCATCHFKITTIYKEGNTKKEKSFPPLTIQQEELHYTLKGGKDIRITKYYNQTGNLTGESATIRLNNKFLPPMPLDLNKFQDLAHLNKRLATIILFH